MLLLVLHFKVHLHSALAQSIQPSAAAPQPLLMLLRRTGNEHFHLLNIETVAVFPKPTSQFDSLSLCDLWNKRKTPNDVGLPARAVSCSQALLGYNGALPN